MTAERWQRLQTVFDAAMSMPVGERQAYVTSCLADDPALAREALAMTRQVEAIREDPVAGILRTAAQAWMDEHRGGHVDPTCAP